MTLLEYYLYLIQATVLWIGNNLIYVCPLCCVIILILWAMVILWFMGAFRIDHEQEALRDGASHN